MWSTNFITLSFNNHFQNKLSTWILISSISLYFFYVSKYYCGINTTHFIHYSFLFNSYITFCREFHKTWNISSEFCFCFITVPINKPRADCAELKKLTFIHINHVYFSLLAAFKMQNFPILAHKWTFTLVLEIYKQI